MSVTPHAQVHQLQLAVLNKSNQLNHPQQGILKMEVDVSLPLMFFPSCFAKHDIFSVIHNNRIFKALIYFLPKSMLDTHLIGKGGTNVILICEGQPLSMI
jgi:hypothetical protein